MYFFLNRVNMVEESEIISKKNIMNAVLITKVLF